MQRSIFAKLYARSHVRADRWYKLGRTMLYGSSRTRRRSRPCGGSWSTRTTPSGCSGRKGSRHPRRYGIAEITPEREYLIAMEFFDGAVEIGEAEVDDDVIDQGLR